MKISWDCAAQLNSPARVQLDLLGKKKKTFQWIYDFISSC